MKVEKLTWKVAENKMMDLVFIFLFFFLPSFWGWGGGGRGGVQREREREKSMKKKEDIIIGSGWNEGKKEGQNCKR